MSARLQHPRGGEGRESTPQQPVQAPQRSRVSTESTSATNGTLEICTCTGSTDRNEPPTGTPQGYGGGDQAQGHAHLAHAHTAEPRPPAGRRVGLFQA